MSDATSLRRNISLKEILGGFPAARTTLSCAAILFIVFNFGSCAAALTSPSRFMDWLNVSQPFTEWVAGYFPFVVSSIAKHLQRAHSPQLIPVHENIVLIDFVLIIAFLGCFAIAECLDVWREPTTIVVHAKHIADKYRAFGNSSVAAAMWAAVISFLVLVILSYFAWIIYPSGLGLLRSVMFYSVLLGVTMLVGMLAIHFLALRLILKSNGLSDEAAV
jgi:hypothetical protein